MRTTRLYQSRDGSVNVNRMTLHRQKIQILTRAVDCVCFFIFLRWHARPRARATTGSRDRMKW